jgi:hypothetical protein
MIDAQYLRDQAATCLQWSRSCFDLATAKQLRLMADEFLLKAEQLEKGGTSPQKATAPNGQPGSSRGHSQVGDGGDAP